MKSTINIGCLLGIVFLIIICFFIFRSCDTEPSQSDILEEQKKEQEDEYNARGAAMYYININTGSDNDFIDVEGMRTSTNTYCFNGTFKTKYNSYYKFEIHVHLSGLNKENYTDWNFNNVILYNMTTDNIEVIPGNWDDGLPPLSKKDLQLYKKSFRK